MVSDSQSTYLSDRKIQDNLLLAHDVVRGYTRRLGSKRCAIKMGIRGVYDSVSWKVLLLLLIQFAFSKNIVDWIFMCVSSTKYSVFINGEVYGYFEGKKGLRQGYPLLPLLFTLVIELLSAMLKNGLHLGHFSAHTECKKLALTQLACADGTVIFLQG